jgi:catechol 2,3-dioxygenase-like lactoylglutathione lyase family enzyme
MRFQGVHHVEFSVLDYENSIKFYDRMFGWLGYQSFWTLDIGYRSTYYVARFPLPHSYIGIQPAIQGVKLNHEVHSTGIHHIAIWASSKKEVDRFHKDFLIQEGAVVTEAPQDYPIYAPGYYAVFFIDPTGIRWELAYTPRIPMPWDILKSLRVIKALRKQHPEWKRGIIKEMMRTLPSRRDISLSQE